MSTLGAVRMHDDGGPDVLQLEPTTCPDPGANEVLVHIEATGARADGLDFSGVVEAVGTRVRSVRNGDAVFGRADVARGGAPGEYVRVPADHLVHKPRRIDHVHAAAVPTAALTAWQALIDAPDPAQSARLERGQTVLVHGAAGAVGGFAVQLARKHDARVIATASGRHADFVLGLGADVFVDYTRQRFDHVARQVDVVLDTIGGEAQARSWPLVRPGGILLSTAGVNGGRPSRPDVRAVDVEARMDVLILQKIAALIEYGELRVPVSRVLPIDEVGRARESSCRIALDGRFGLGVAG